MSTIKSTAFQTALFVGVFSVMPVWGQAVDEAVIHPAIPLLDEAGNHVLVSGRPYSPRTSCGTAGCHDYEAITHSFHLEQGRDEADDAYGAMHGLPQLVGPGYFGGYNCMGGNNQDQTAAKYNATVDDFKDYGAPGITMRCATCHSGGGWMEKDRKGRRYDETDPATVTPFDGDYYNRGTDGNNASADVSTVAQWDWKKSGVVENDCFICHVETDRLQPMDPALQTEGGPDGLTLWRTLRNTQLISQGHFRYAATATLEFLNLKHPQGSSTDQSLVTLAKSNVQSTSDGHGGATLSFDLALDGSGNPILHWNAAAFDQDGKANIPMVSFPPNDTCMSCHRTSNSRRGFYGFGEGAAAVYDEGGFMEEDYQDDVHYGKTYQDGNGESRQITTCNACHARAYFRPAWENVDLNADHNFLKGNSDMDVHNDRDYRPGAKSCRYCHDTGPRPVVPSGHDGMLAAHLERWKSGGDLWGYPASTLEQVTRTHLDVVSCQTCHITGKAYNGVPLQVMYRYRREEDGKLRMVPYNPKARYFWQDRNSGRVLTKTERDSVMQMEVDENGNRKGYIVDPQTGNRLAEVETAFSHGSWRFSDPESYAGFAALKQVYDKLLSMKGVTGPNTAMVWTEINNYLMSHNTRPAVQALDCESCHNRKSDGSISSLVKPDGVLGTGSTKTVTTLVDPRLVEDGLVVLDMPYMKMDADGKVTENVSDILYYTLVNPSMTRLNAETAPEMRGVAQRQDKDTALTTAGIADGEHRAAMAAALSGTQTYVFRPNYGAAPLRGVSILSDEGFIADMIMPYTSFRASLPADEIAASAGDAAAGGAKLASDPLLLETINAEGDVIDDLLGIEMLVVLPYRGAQTGASAIQVLRSDTGQLWDNLGSDPVLRVQPARNGQPGYVVIRTTRLGHLALVDANGAVVASCATVEACGY